MNFLSPVLLSMEILLHSKALINDPYVYIIFLWQNAILKPGRFSKFYLK
jgi:hypothetical protein